MMRLDDQLHRVSLYETHFIVRYIYMKCNKKYEHRDVYYNLMCVPISEE